MKYKPNDRDQLAAIRTSILIQYITNPLELQCFVFGEEDDPDWQLDNTTQRQMMGEALGDIMFEIDHRVPMPSPAARVNRCREPWHAKRYHYELSWSEEDREYVATCKEFPSLSWLDCDPGKAVEGIMRMVALCVADLMANHEPVPYPGL